MTDLNRILNQKEQNSTIECSYQHTKSQIEDWTDLCLSFCASILHNISTKIEETFPKTQRAFLKLVINNTRDADKSELLGLADMFVLSDFLF